MDRDQADRLQDRLTAGAHGGHRRGRGGGGGSQFRGGGGGGGGRNRETTISKTLSRLLRHQAENAGIKLDDEGYAPLDRVMAWAPLRNLSPTLDEIRSLVASNDKQRFTLKLRGEGDGEGEGEQAGQDPADFLIRANQGHSIKLESTAHLEQLTPATVPPTVVHGTYFAFWPRIVASGGLKPMSRTHVHCATGLPEGGSGPDAAAAVVSGMRRDAELLVYVDAARSMRDGALTWWRSANGVVLCEGDAEAGLVPSRYFAEVRGREGSGVGVLWKDGERVADLPAGLKIVVPHGKQRGGGGGRGRGRGRGRGA
ncbi:uncharacterized protein E0L32_012153 [Thyridium curvatum]|uniref:2'-phosphotransferase n=1 Tax=Thyridium curvatum TaxID=1093900 RepID=A0A507BBT9_9PEZI|nr:uncharacterized protein E0L32_012153 [Thyridium curvatum]TPX17367.1 hypothetical protein E0L32_012153 [Thyridium curvatum]